MTRALRNISASVEKRLLNLSRQSGEDFQYVLMRYGLERLMYRLSRSVYAKEFVVKGARLHFPLVNCKNRIQSGF